MGGYGSGRQGGRPTVERTNCVKVSVHDVVRGFDGVAPIARKWIWHEGVEGELSATVLPLEGRAPVVRLCYRFDHFSRTTGDQSQFIHLEWSPAHFGGRRWWWVCPRTGRRVTKLYLPNGAIQFWSRQAFGLDYQSTRETWLDRAHRKAARLYRKLGSDSDTFSDHYPDKPKGMHWKTYNRICDRIETVEETIDAGFATSAARLLTR